MDNRNGIAGLPTLAETVRAHDLGANKKLGQHFLLDMNLTDKIARLAEPLDGVSVAEIGPGPGGLTRALLLRGASKVVAIEMDQRFIPALAEIGDRAEGRLEIAQGDALKYDIAANLPAPRKIVANLPYNVGTKMLIDWVTASPIFWEQMVLMFQLEVAQRVVAQPGENHYGRLAVLCQSVAHCRLAFEVPARAFTPPPKVDSAVVVLEPLDAPFPDLKTLGRVTQAAFGQRRKMLRRSLRSLAEQNNLVLEDWLTLAGVDPKARPETLPISAFQALAGMISA
ncbi:16S rRNA (adenine(1518)-N(6)/adenine(1519)-N(6))-dimethyltransferase RsmA [Litorimonas sp. WD9-15]|uniref:16S rRNA (adenine(1518)-N(6)/adenine(1519)-N(6))- dimethyltransferase RsmA n=1 Tax=Litorimonas sp. WD9-15 TaxID=3418716 RepID=UPI003D08C98E